MPQQKKKEISTPEYISGNTVLKTRPTTRRTQRKNIEQLPDAKQIKNNGSSSSGDKQAAKKKKSSSSKIVPIRETKTQPQKKKAQTSKKRKPAQRKKGITKRELKKRKREAARRKKEKEFWEDSGFTPQYKYTVDTKNGPVYLLVLSAVCVLVLLVCMQYLHSKSTIMFQNRQMAQIDRDISVLRSDNDAYYKKVQTSVTLDEILDHALNDLGLHYPSKKQLRYIEVDDKSYVRQYCDVPKK